MERELGEAAAEGYRVTYGDMANNVLILEEAPDKYQYRLIQNESMDAAITEGFSIVATTFSADRYKAGMVMGKPVNAGPSQAHDYRVLGTARTKTLQKELNEAAAKGYELTAMSTYGANTALLERRSPRHHPPLTDTCCSPPHALLPCRTKSTMPQRRATP